MKVWDGTSATRSDAMARKAPDGEDWKVITQEVQNTQEFLANLVANAHAMPNLVKDAKAVKKKLDSLQDAIGKLTAPEDVRAHIVKFEEELKELSKVYTHAAEVLQTVKFLQQQLLNLSRRIDERSEEMTGNYRVFENRAGNWQRSREDAWNKRLEKLEDQVGAISLALGLKTFGE